MADCHYCRPSDIVTDGATVSLTAGAAAAAFPLANLYDRKAHSVFKATGTSCTIRATYGGAKTLQAIALIHHNLAGATVTVTNGAGFSNGLTIPSTPLDALPLDPWESYIGLANTSSTTWDIAISGASANVAIGELLLIETLRTLRIRWEPEEDEQHRAIVLETDYGVRQRYGMGVRQRAFRGLAYLEADRADILALQRDARGPLKSFCLVPDSTVNDALFVDLSIDVRTFRRRNPGFTDMALAFREQQKGLAL